MTVYKVDKKYLFLLILIMITAAIFSWSVAAAGLSTKKLIVMVPVFIIVGYNLLTFTFRKIEIEGDEIRLYTLFGKKSIKLEELDEVAIVKLKGRVIVILSDHEKFIFLSSFYENFNSMLTYIRSGVADELKNSIDKVDMKDVKKRIVLMKLFMIGLILFFIGATVYNLLY